MPGARARHRDFEQKAEEHLNIGIEQYWIIDPEHQEVVVFTRRDSPAGPSWESRRFVGDELIKTDLLPDFPGRVSELWIDTDVESNAESPDDE